jgi:chemotaxis protein methyltransferase CheR
MTNCSDQDVSRFRGIITSRLGLYFDDTKLTMLADLLRRRLDIRRWSSQLYFGKLEHEPSADECRALARALTIAETSFFRNADQFRAFTEVVLPECLRTRASTKTLRILSAGCASGEEAYSIAILIREALVDPSWNVTIRAVDVNPDALERAARACYTNWALRETPAAIRQKWFRSDGNVFILDSAIRNAVKFDERNLVEDGADLWQAGAYDIVFCRNVLMYFTPDKARTVVARITEALASDGYLFLGHAETLRGLSESFHLQHAHNAFYYQRKEITDRRQSTSAATNIVSDTPAPSIAEVVDSADTWVEAVQKAAQRIESLAEASAPTQIQSTAPVPQYELGSVLDLVQRERFAEALERIRAFPAESMRDPDVMLLRAALLTHSGQLTAAAETCRQLLTIDDLSAGAHYLLALCHEGVGDRLRAIEYDRIAIYLDPGFAMPYLHLGLLARRASDSQGAREAFTRALTLLRTEDASRLLLFGGGFSRDALLALCGAELNAGGGVP